MAKVTTAVVHTDDEAVRLVTGYRLSRGVAGRTVDPNQPLVNKPSLLNRVQLTQSDRSHAIWRTTENSPRPQLICVSFH